MGSQPLLAAIRESPGVATKTHHSQIKIQRNLFKEKQTRCKFLKVIVLINQRLFKIINLNKTKEPMIFK